MFYIFMFICTINMYIYVCKCILAYGSLAIGSKKSTEVNRLI